MSRSPHAHRRPCPSGISATLSDTRHTRKRAKPLWPLTRTPKGARSGPAPLRVRLSSNAKCGRTWDNGISHARIVDASRTLFDSIPIIVEHGYVLVRQRDRRITGIVTASDLSLQFQILSEPFLLLREIELHVRQFIRGKITAEDFLLLDNPPRPDHPQQDPT